MKRIVASFMMQLLFWMLFFVIARVLFLLYNIPFLRIEHIPLTEVVQSFWYALPLDLATACYFIIIPFLILIGQCLFKTTWLNKINRVYTLVAIALFSLLVTAELGIYPEWKTKMPYKALNYLFNPSEVYNSASSTTFFLLVFLAVALSYGSYFLYRRFFYIPITDTPKNKFIVTPLFIIIIFPLIGLGARGGWQQIPINQSEAYYSHHNILNLASVNSGFNIAISIIENYKNMDKNPYAFYELDDAKNKVELLYSVQKDSTVKILKTNRPNIVILILESWSADLIESIGGEPGITPEFNNLEKDGVLFTNLYATGPRSEQAMGSIFSGFPAHPISSVTVQPEKFSKLPTITKSLIDVGYSTSFYFGGQLRYGNIKGYILYNGFNRIIEHNDFGSDVIRGKLGVHDEFVLARQLDDLKNEKQPFFSGLFTLSSHSPYDQPMEEVLTWGDNERDYINSAYYTDKCLGDYFRKAKHEKWFSNTLFIIVADHSHNSYRNWAFTTPSYHKIPLLLYGEVIKDEFKGVKIDKLANQSDLATTISKQLNLPSSQFKWSKDLFNPYVPNFAYYSFEEGFGWISSEGHFVYEPRINHYSEDAVKEDKKEEIHKQGKSFLQTLFDEYMKL